MAPRRAFPHRPRALVVIAACAVGLALTGCGSGHTRQSPAARLCAPRVRRFVARTLALPDSKIVTVPATGNNGMPQCSFTAPSVDGRRFDLTVNVDTSPQPYAVLSRTIVERQQVFSPHRLVPAPIAVLNLGLLASWFPDIKELISTDGVRLVTTTVMWHGARQAQEILFATRISRMYLGRSRAPLAKMFP